MGSGRLTAAQELFQFITLRRNVNWFATSVEAEIRDARLQYYENDFFTASDRDYTQGILIEKVHPDFSRFLFMRILWHPGTSDFKYGLAIEHNAYTPNQIDKYVIQYGDRPYAGVLIFKTFLIASNVERKRRISVSFSAGVVGSDAGGEQIQRTIHHLMSLFCPN